MALRLLIARAHMLRFAFVTALASTALLPTSARAEVCSPARVMVVLDKSSSMRTGKIGNQTKWDVAVDGLEQLLATYDAEAEFGLMTYPRPNQCGAGGLDVAPALHNKNAILNKLSSPPPSSGNYTPIAQTLDAARLLPEMKAARGPRHLVLITDGWQYCVPYDEDEQRFSATQPVKRLYNAGVTVWVVGFGAEVDACALNKMAVAAHTERPNCDVHQDDPAASDNCYYQVDNQAELQAALTEIAGVAAAEICDGADNDCDGQVDEDLTRACDSACGPGTETCDAGSWVGCDAPPPQDETCDGDDNDCDGEVDEADNMCDGDAVCEAGVCLPPNSETGSPAGCACDTGSTDPSTFAPFAIAGLLLFRRRRR